jgi:hypothetical protein
VTSKWIEFFVENIEGPVTEVASQTRRPIAAIKPLHARVQSVRFPPQEPERAKTNRRARNEPPSCRAPTSAADPAARLVVRIVAYRASLPELLRSAESAARDRNMLLRSLARSVDIQTDGEIVFQQACLMGLEGIVSKRRGSPCHSGRSRHWLKSKNPNSEAVRREAEEDWER